MRSPFPAKFPPKTELLTCFFVNKEDLIALPGATKGKRNLMKIGDFADLGINVLTSCPACSDSKSIMVVSTAYDPSPSWTYVIFFAT